MIAGRKYAPACLGDVLILGLGASGKAAVRYLTSQPQGRVRSLTVYGGAFSQANADFMGQWADSDITVVFDSEDVQGSYDLCIASPGISMFEPFYQSAQKASAEVISEVEFAWRESAEDAVWVAITGTNGKTTTTSLAAHLALACGMNAAAVGNIGDTCLAAVASGKVQVYVAEVSSYQLASTARFAPQVAVLTNITPDHLHWHKSHEAYAAAKAKVFANLSQVPDALAVIDATDDEARGVVRTMKAAGADLGYEYLPVGTASGLASDMRQVCGSANSAFVSSDNHLMVCFGGEERDLGPASSLQIKGAHNVSNALMALAAILRIGGDPEVCVAALATFAPLEHRIEPCGSVKGIPCYNDSKATNVDATLVALPAFAPAKPVVLLGGDDKGTDLAPLVQKCVECARAVVCFGDAKERFLAAFADCGIPVHEAPHMAEAFAVALQVATTDDVILLSPACASFDEFNSFEERGAVFKELVASYGGDEVQ